MKYITSLILVVVFSAFIPAPGKHLQVVFMGDSITEGTAMANPAKDAPGVYAAALLRAMPGVASVDQANLGYSGHTTVDFLPATHSDFDSTVAAVQHFKTSPEALLIFSIMLGTNDSAIDGPNGSPVSPADYKKNLHLVIAALFSKFPNARVVLQYPIWYSENTHNGSRYLKEGLNRLQSYYPQLNQLVKELSGMYAGKVFAGSTAGMTIFKEKKLSLLIAEKGNSGIFYLHPNEKGSEVLGKIWIEGIAKAIR
jgi:lysophospholipase L1-like esterase